jgi:hypothetical protein
MYELCPAAQQTKARVNKRANRHAKWDGLTRRNAAPAESTTRRKTNVAPNAPYPVRLEYAADDGVRAFVKTVHSFTATDQPSEFNPARVDMLKPTIDVPSKTASTSSERTQDFMESASLPKGGIATVLETPDAHDNWWECNLSGFDP